MFILSLNDMRSSKVEILEPVAKAETREELIAFLEREKAVEGWKGGQWGKAFKQGSVLEWYNKPYEHDLIRCIVEFPSKEVHIELMKQKAALDWENQLGSIPDILEVQGEIEIIPGQQLTGQMLQQQTKAQQILELHYHTHTCTICNYKCGYVLRAGKLFYDSGCFCTVGPNTLTARSWDDLAKHYNNLKDSAKLIEFRGIWGLS